MVAIGIRFRIWSLLAPVPSTGLLKPKSCGFLITLNVVLPVLRSRLTRYHNAMSKEKQKSSPIPIRVLLVDNEKDHASAMTESLERIGLECSFATSGPEGVQMLSKDTYDLSLIHI